MMNAVFWDVTSRGSCKNGRFGEKYRPHHQGDKNRRTRNNVSSNYQPKHAASVGNAAACWLFRNGDEGDMFQPVRR
jgi:hypothetical protein